MIAQLDAMQIRLRPSRAAVRLVSHVLFQGRPLTTGMRWLNPFLLAHFSLAKRLPPLRPVEKPLFILGTGRSGTTILGKVLSLHPLVGFLNEPKALWHAIYPGEDVIGSYTRGPARYRLDASDAAPAVIQAAHRLYGYYLALTCSRRVLDKYPEMIFRIPFLQAIFPDARFLFLVRDGWDTCASIKSWSEKEGVARRAEAHDWWGANQRKWQLLLRDVVAPDPTWADAYDEVRAITRQEDKAAVEWIVTMREGLRCMAATPEKFHLVRYEPLAREPGAVLPAILDFCQLPPDEVLLRYGQQILKPAPAKRPFPLHPAIVPIFLETLAALEYRSE